VLQTIRRLLIRPECFRLEREFAGPDPPCGYSEPELLQSGAMRSQPHDAWPDLALDACSTELP
jgi:hypothetical protein